jgi:hypothetical protein
VYLLGGVGCAHTVLRRLIAELGGRGSVLLPFALPAVASSHGRIRMPVELPRGGTEKGATIWVNGGAPDGVLQSSYGILSGHGDGGSTVLAAG